MSLKEDFMKIKSYEEFDKQREKFKDLQYDKEILNHMNEIFGECYVGGDIRNGLIEEVRKNIL